MINLEERRRSRAPTSFPCISLHLQQLFHPNPLTTTVATVCRSYLRPSLSSLNALATSFFPLQICAHHPTAIAKINHVFDDLTTPSTRTKLISAPPMSSLKKSGESPAVVTVKEQCEKDKNGRERRKQRRVLLRTLERRRKEWRTMSVEERGTVRGRGRENVLIFLNCFHFFPS